MLLELTILLVLLAWTLGNTIMRADYSRAAGSFLEFVYRLAGALAMTPWTERPSEFSFAFAVLCDRETHAVLIRQSSPCDGPARIIAAATCVADKGFVTALVPAVTLRIPIAPKDRREV